MAGEARLGVVGARRRELLDRVRALVVCAGVAACSVVYNWGLGTSMGRRVAVLYIFSEAAFGGFSRLDLDKL